MCLQKAKTHRESYDLRNTNVSAIIACSWSHIGVDWLCASNSKWKNVILQKKLLHCCSFFYINTLNISTSTKCNGNKRTIVQKKQLRNDDIHETKELIIQILKTVWGFSIFLLLSSFSAVVLRYLFGGLMHQLFISMYPTTTCHISDWMEDLTFIFLCWLSVNSLKSFAQFGCKHIGFGRRKAANPHTGEAATFACLDCRAS